MKNKLWLFALLFLLLFMGIKLYIERPVHYGRGIKAPDFPVQEMLKDAPIVRFKGYMVTPLARYNVKAKVLAKERYWIGRESRLAPYDFALGWEIMSDEAVLEDIKISQSGRFYHWKLKEPVITPDDVIRSSANTHVIPGTDDVLKIMHKVRPGHIIEMSGYLVQINADDGWHWGSSLSRTDTGNGACEVMLVKEIKIEEPPAES